MTVIIRLDMGARQLEKRELPAKYEKLAGRALISQLCQDEVEALCYPLGDKNKFFVAPGFLSGKDFDFGGRISMGGKSPLTRAIAISNGGGLTASYLDALGIRALIVEGLPSSDELYILVIGNKSAELVPANDLQGKGTYETAALLQEKYGRQNAIFCIGPAGEMLMPTAAIINTDAIGTASRVCGRGGLGAVMGSKRLKAVVIERPQANISEKADPKKFAEAAGKMKEVLMNINKKNKNVKYVLDSHCLPTWEPAAVNINYHAIAPVKPETARAFRDYCAIDDPESIARLNDSANDLGIDTLETAATLRILMEAEIISWGDGKKALQLLQEVAQGTSLGFLLGQGSSLTAQAMGKSLERNFSSFSQDEQIGFCIAAALQKDRENEHIFAAERENDLAGDLLYLTNQLLDTLGICLYSASAFLKEPKSWSLMAELLNAKYGWELTSTDLAELCRNCQRIEEQFNREAGFTGEHNTLGGYLPVGPITRINNYPLRHEHGFTFTTL